MTGAEVPESERSKKMATWFEKLEQRGAETAPPSQNDLLAILEKPAEEIVLNWYGWQVVAAVIGAVLGGATTEVAPPKAFYHICRGSED